MAEDRMVIEIGSESLNKMFEELCRNAMEQLHAGPNTWRHDNPFVKIITDVFHENEEEIKNVMRVYIRNIISDDEFLIWYAGSIP